jgi:PII-like signaling protein
MKHQEPGRRMRIYVGESDQWHGRTLYSAIVQEARKRGMAGATVARGVMGYAGTGAVHEPHLFQLSAELPVVIEIIDSAEKIQAFLPCVDDMVKEGLVTLSDVEVVRYSTG